MHLDNLMSVSVGLIALGLLVALWGQSRQPRPEPIPVKSRRGRR